jgi:predicted PhzF superfamily epimerase YddE/YHI9
MRYLHYDVFTDTMFEGNQLAVFHDARGLSTAQMQTITKEMNFREMHVHPAGRIAGHRRADAHLHAGHELPMAGHPTIGSTFALAHLKTIGRGARAGYLAWASADECGADLGGRSPVVRVDGSAAARFRQPASARPTSSARSASIPAAVELDRDCRFEEVYCGNGSC